MLSHHSGHHSWCQRWLGTWNSNPAGVSVFSEIPALAFGRNPTVLLVCNATAVIRHLRRCLMIPLRQYSKVVQGEWSCCMLYVGTLAKLFHLGFWG